jgi:peptidyl-prolyl cis-trans isomerase B (cyclophilin B)
MKKTTTLLLFLLILTAGCAVNRATDQSANDLKPLDLNSNADNSSQTNSTNQNNQMINQDANLQAEQNQVSTTTNEGSTDKFALIKTSMGDIKVKLNAEKAPISVANFEQYASNKFYDGTIFHRVMSGFMIQGGGFTKDGVQKSTKEPIKNEAKNGLSNKRGTIAMARTGIVDSATAQFYINLVDNNMLNYQDDAKYGYAVFGEVVEGMDVVDKIAQVETKTNGAYENWPVENVVIKSIKLLDK